jgi:hypothetical protein
MNEEKDEMTKLERQFQLSLDLQANSGKVTLKNMKELLDFLPDNWIVFELSLDLNTDTLFVLRISNEQIYSLSLPLSRRIDRLHLYNGGKLWFQRLRDVLDRSYESTRHVESYITRQKKSEWWNIRNKLDSEMNELIHEIEDIWLGAFKVDIYIYIYIYIFLCI